MTRDDFIAQLDAGSPGTVVILNALGFELVACACDYPACTGWRFEARQPATMLGFPIRFDATLCAPGEIWFELPNGNVVRVYPPVNEETKP